MTPRGGSNVSTKFYQDRIYRPLGTCKVCGQPWGAYHDGSKCADRWIKQAEAEKAQASNQGAKDGPQPA